MTPANLDAIKKLWAASSPGEWAVRRMKIKQSLPEMKFIQAPRADPKHPYDIEILGEDDTLYPTREGDLEFVAASHQIVPELVAEVERLRGALKKYEVPEGWLSQPYSEWMKVLIERDHEIANLMKETEDTRKHYGALVSQAQDGQNIAERERDEWKNKWLSTPTPGQAMREIEELKAKIEKMGDALTNQQLLTVGDAAMRVVVALGITREKIATGPQLLLLLEDAEKLVVELKAKLAQQSKDAREVYDRMKGSIYSYETNRDGSFVRLKDALFRRALSILDVLSTPI